MSRTHRWWLFLGLAVVALLAGCNNDNSTLQKTQKTVAETSKGEDTGGEKAQDKAAPAQAEKKDDVIPDTIYPELPMAALTPKERAVVKRVTEAELCPCKGATVSLHQCLQKVDGRCSLATYAGLTAMQGVKEGLSEKDVLAGVGKFIQDSYKTYSFDLEGVPHKGKVDAPVVIVEFADFECPYCSLARQIIQGVLEARGEKVVFYFMHYPLPFHKMAMPAAIAANAAGKQGRFWEMYHLLFDNQKILSAPKIENLALEMGLNMDKFRKDLADPTLAQVVKAQRTQGESANVDSTPSFFINGRKYLGEKTPEALIKAVDDALKEKEAQKK
jgi:protein-disulfide isomerase